MKRHYNRFNFKRSSGDFCKRQKGSGMVLLNRPKALVTNAYFSVLIANRLCRIIALSARVAEPPGSTAAFDPPLTYASSETYSFVFAALSGSESEGSVQVHPDHYRHVTVQFIYRRDHFKTSAFHKFIELLQQKV